MENHVLPVVLFLVLPHGEGHPLLVAQLLLVLFADKAWSVLLRLLLQKT